MSRVIPLRGQQPPPTTTPRPLKATSRRLEARAPLRGCPHDRHVVLSSQLPSIWHRGQDHSLPLPLSERGFGLGGDGRGLEPLQPVRVHLRVPWKFVAKRELLWVPFFGWALALAGQVIVDRRNRERAVQSLARSGGPKMKKVRHLSWRPTLR